jgi:hypothetical protein
MPYVVASGRTLSGDVRRGGAPGARARHFSTKALRRSRASSRCRESRSRQRRASSSRCGSSSQMCSRPRLARTSWFPCATEKLLFAGDQPGGSCRRASTRDGVLVGGGVDGSGPVGLERLGRRRGLSSPVLAPPHARPRCRAGSHGNRRRRGGGTNELGTGHRRHSPCEPPRRCTGRARPAGDQTARDFRVFCPGCKAHCAAGPPNVRRVDRTCSAWERLQIWEYGARRSSRSVMFETISASV